ncbi:MAG: endonuclease V [Candidatus Thorarchaeota archaeon]|nr:MAG: endonuclease V [Candidatus Thorarchaeota archaeon]
MSELIAQLKAEQRRLSERVIMEDVPPFESKIVAGVDVSYVESVAVGCLVVMDLQSQKTIQTEQKTVECTAPYIPGYFFLREGPVLIELLEDLHIPGPLLVDGNGTLHPRRLGLASHLGIRLDLQTVGVAKSLLMGEIQQRQGNMASILDHDDCVGTALWLTGRKNPVFVSVGHRISLSTAVEIVQHSSTSGYPEPLRRAHSIAKETLQELQTK